MGLWSLRSVPTTDRASGPLSAVGEICSPDGAVWARWSDRSLLDPVWQDPAAIAHARESTWIVSTVDPGAGDEEPWKRWNARAAVTAAIERAAGVLGGVGARLLLAPTSDGVVSDLPSVLFLDQECGKVGAGRVGIVLEPAAMLDASMVENAVDHLGRLFGLASLTSVAGVVVSNVARSGAEGAVGPCAPAAGLVDPAALREMAKALQASSDRPVIFRGEAAEARAWLGGG